MNLFMRLERIGPFGIVDLILFKKILYLHMRLELPGQGRDKAEVEKLKLQGKVMEAVS